MLCRALSLPVACDGGCLTLSFPYKSYSTIPSILAHRYVGSIQIQYRATVVTYVYTVAHHPDFFGSVSLIYLIYQHQIIIVVVLPHRIQADSQTMTLADAVNVARRLSAKGGISEDLMSEYSIVS